MSQEVLEGNRLIAEFMDKKDVLGILDTEPFVTNVWFSHNQIDDKIAQGLRIELYYHSEWNWIMPVVSKCYSLCNEGQNSDEEVKLSEALLSCDLNELFPAVIQFINFYNQTQKR